MRSKVGAATCALAMTFGSSAAHAAVDLTAIDAGSVIFTEPNNPGTPLSGGDQNTPFSLRLPADAECPGDSKSDQWRVESFIIPARDNPADMVFNSFDLEDDGQWPLLDVDSQKFLAEFMPENPAPGLPGQIQALPVFTFELYGRSELPAGRYIVGIACSFYRETGKFWSTPVSIAYDEDATNSNLTWQVTDPAAPENMSQAADSEASSLWLVAVVAAFLTLIFVLFRRQNSRRSNPVNSELK